MPRCKICGKFTLKNRQECKGCRALKEVARKKEKASDTEFFEAKKHLDNNPDLIIINWGSFSKKKSKV